MTKSNSDISVIIPTYNRSKYIGECIDSILKQTMPPKEVIVVDDGSTDSTVEVVHSYGDRVTYLKKDNGGKSTALNLVLPLVTGEYIWIFDDDDVALPRANEDRLAILEANPSIGFVYGNHIWAQTDQQGVLQPTERIDVPKLNDRQGFVRLLRFCFFTLQSVLMRRTCLDRVGAFNEGLHRSQDYEYMIRMAREVPFVKCDSDIFLFRRHAGARGPAGMVHAVGEKSKVWVQYDRMIGQWIREHLRLEEYALTEPACGREQIWQREALVRRAAVMASKGMPEAMLADLLSSTQIEDGQGIRTSEVQECYAIMDHPYYWNAVKQCRFSIFRLFDLGDSNMGRDLLRYLARSCYWQIQQGDPHTVGRLRLFWTFGLLMLASNQIR